MYSLGNLPEENDLLLKDAFYLCSLFVGII